MQKGSREVVLRRQMESELDLNSFDLFAVEELGT